MDSLSQSEASAPYTIEDPLSAKTRINDRRCVASGEALEPQAPALRFVRDPMGILTLDLSGKLPGRGAWLSADATLLQQALKKGSFARSLKESVTLPEGLTPEVYAGEIKGHLLRRTLNQLGLARRAGQCLTGFEVVKAAVPRLVAYLTPIDARPDGVTKITRVLEAASQSPHIMLEVEGNVVADAIGAPGAVHLGLIPGKAAASALYEARRLRQFTGSD